VAVLATTAHFAEKRKSKFLLPRFLNSVFTIKSYSSANNLAGLKIKKIEVKPVIRSQLQNTRYKCLSIQKAYVSTTICVSTDGDTLAVTLVASAGWSVEAHYHAIVFK